MDWYVEWGVIIHKDGIYSVGWTNVRPLFYRGTDLEQAKIDAWKWTEQGDNILWYDWDEHWSVGTHQVTCTSKNAYLSAYRRGVSTFAFVRVKWQNET